MSRLMFTITGLNHRYGSEFLEPGMTVKLVKEPDNEYDSEAIKVILKGIGQIGYVANSTYTVIGETMSAGRIYDKIVDGAKAKVVLVTDKGVICKVKKKYEQIGYDLLLDDLDKGIDSLDLSKDICIPDYGDELFSPDASWEEIRTIGRYLISLSKIETCILMSNDNKDETRASLIKKYEMELDKINDDDPYADKKRECIYSFIEKAKKRQ